MSCDIYKTLMMDSLFDEIAAEDQKKLDGHIKNCPSCEKELAEMKQTVNTLEKWPDENPAPIKKRRTILPMFKNSSSKIKQNLSRIAVAAAVLLLCLSLANFRLSYSQDKFELSFSLFGNSEQSAGEKQVMRANNLTQEDVRLIVDLIDSANRKQQAEAAAVLSDFYKAVEMKRQADMMVVARGMRSIQDDTQRKFGAANEVLTKLINYSDSYRLEGRKVKSEER